jgi:hypothetical protein
MKSMVAWSGWGVCLMMAAFGAYMFQVQDRAHRAALADLESRLTAQAGDDEAGPALDDESQVALERDAAFAQVAELELALAEAERNAVEVIGDTDGESDATDGPAVSKRSEAQQQMMEVQAAAITEMVYADLFTALGLSGEAEEAMSGILADRMMGDMDAAQAALKAGDVSARQVYLEQEAARAEAYAALREVLDRETMADFEAYDSTRDDRMLEKTVGPQIVQFSSGLTEENQTVVQQVAVEEFGYYQRTFFESDKLFTLGENANWQIEAMESMQSRLAEVLDEQQMGEVNRWLNLGFKQMEAMKKR